MNKWWDFTPVEFLCTRSLWLNVFFHLTIWNHKPLYMWKWLYKTTICSTAFDMKMSYWRPFMSTLNSALNSPFRILSQTDKHGIARWSRTTFIENWRNSGSVSLPIGCLFKTFVLKGPHPCLSDHNFFTYDYLSFSSHTDFSRLHNTSLISLTSLNTSITSGTYLFPMQMWRTRTAIYVSGPISSVALVALRSDPLLTVANGAGILPGGGPDSAVFGPPKSKLPTSFICPVVL